MMPVTEGIAAGATAAAEQQRGVFLQLQIMCDQASAEMGTIAEPAMAAAAAAAELIATRRQGQRLGSRLVWRLRLIGSGLIQISLIQFSWI